jgi:hypothetical protein
VPSLVIELYALAGHAGILLGGNSATLWQFPSCLMSRYPRGMVTPRQDGFVPPCILVCDNEAG